MDYADALKNHNKLIDLSGLVAVVTGGGDGIGRAISFSLAAAGASVAVSNRTLSKAEAVADEINRGGGRAVAIGCDVSRDEDLVALIVRTVAAFGKLNILVNNVGRSNGGRENPLTVTREYVEDMFAVNVIAPWRLASLAAPRMKEAGYGSIINISSTSSTDTQPNMFVYGATKAALNHMAGNLAFDLGPMGIRINNVAPGATRTRALESVLSPEIERTMLRHTPLQRLGQVDDITDAVLFFASPMSAWISGQTLFVAGGGRQNLD